MTWIRKDDESSESFAECSAFQNGLQNAEKAIVDNQAEALSETLSETLSEFELTLSELELAELELALSAQDRSNVSFNLFRHYTETNAYMIRKVLIFSKLGRSDMFKFKLAIKISLIQNLI